MLKWSGFLVSFFCSYGTPTLKSLLNPFAMIPLAWCQCYKTFSSLLMIRPNKLECLCGQILSNLVWHLLAAQWAYPRRKHLKGPPIGFALALPWNSKTWLERVSTGKPSSLLDIIVSDERKQFYNIDTWIVKLFNVILLTDNNNGKCLPLSVTFTLV